MQPELDEYDLQFPYPYPGWASDTSSSSSNPDSDEGENGASVLLAASLGARRRAFKKNLLSLRTGLKQLLTRPLTSPDGRQKLERLLAQVRKELHKFRRLQRAQWGLGPPYYAPYTWAPPDSGPGNYAWEHPTLTNLRGAHPTPTQAQRTGCINLTELAPPGLTVHTLPRHITQPALAEAESYLRAQAFPQAHRAPNKSQAVEFGQAFYTYQATQGPLRAHNSIDNAPNL